MILQSWLENKVKTTIYWRIKLKQLFIVVVRRTKMKITKTQLKQIIKEELESALKDPRTDELEAEIGRAHV